MSEDLLQVGNKAKAAKTVDEAADRYARFSCGLAQIFADVTAQKRRALGSAAEETLRNMQEQGGQRLVTLVRRENPGLSQQGVEARVDQVLKEVERNLRLRNVPRPKAV